MCAVKSCRGRPFTPSVLPQASNALRNSAIESVKWVASTKFLRPQQRKNQLFANVNPMKQSLNLFHAENDPIAALNAANAKAERNRRAVANANDSANDGANDNL